MNFPLPRYAKLRSFHLLVSSSNSIRVFALPTRSHADAHAAFSPALHRSHAALALPAPPSYNTPWPSALLPHLPRYLHVALARPGAHRSRQKLSQRLAMCTALRLPLRRCCHRSRGCGGPVVVAQRLVPYARQTRQRTRTRAGSVRSQGGGDLAH